MQMTGFCRADEAFGDSSDPDHWPITGTSHRETSETCIMRSLLVASALSLVVLLTGCDLFGGESAEIAAARREAEGKAVGSACRHAMRAIEDCYSLNPKTLKAAVFAGWREMDEYMRENKMEGVAPTIVRPVPGSKEALAAEAAAKADAEGKGKSAKSGKSGKSSKSEDGGSKSEGKGEAKSDH